MDRSKEGREGKSQCHWEERMRRQPEGNEFEAATPLICLVLSATDKLGQIGEEKEKGDEKGNKEHFISPAWASVSERHAEEKLYQLARLLQSPHWLQDVWGCSKEHNLLFNPNSPIDLLLYWVSASKYAHTYGRAHEPTSTHSPVDTHSLRIELEWRQFRLVSQPRIKPNPSKKCLWM